MENVPTTEAELKRYIMANLENAIKQTEQGFPDRAKGNAECALKQITEWRALTD